MAGGGLLPFAVNASGISGALAPEMFLLRFKRILRNVNTGSCNMLLFFLLLNNVCDSAASNARSDPEGNIQAYPTR